MELLSPRLKTALTMLAKCNCLADIGSDHGYLITSAVLSGLAKRGIAVEINELPYAQTTKTINQNQLSSLIDVRLGDGLSPIHKGEIDALCIAGMGGGTITGILERGVDQLASVTQLVLQPNVDAAQLRAHLLKYYVITDERLVADGDFIYQVIKAQPGQEACPYTKVELEYGRINIAQQSDLLKNVLCRDIAHWEKILDQIGSNHAERRKEISAWITQLKEVFA